MRTKRSEVRSNHVGFLISDRDLQKLNEVLCKKDVTMSDYLRNLLYEALEKEGL